CQQYNDLLYSF
nr:immunoglobulin light chain junction region [Macaca mulatta]MOW09226.1 immunoglobulin light chain junction region [Macaca mulatta]MOW10330.1 immunoglobulin light chain junction region [Macaca mulatta]MOW13924.1 immunoglobulin light chain junction region [Macaca mulatta]MOW14633.1 immunoglobulin light chain junction region [Macaca mulatta]